MDDLIIGCATNYSWDQLKYWVRSINDCGFTGKKVLILFNCDKDTTRKVIDAGFDIMAMTIKENGDLFHMSEFPVHVERFIHIYNYLLTNNFRYVITTDVKDVIFQRNPIEFLESNVIFKDLVFSSESIQYKNEPWGDRNLLETFGEMIYNTHKDNEIYNVGVLAGTGEAMRDLCLNIFQLCLNRPIPIVDQSTFNLLINSLPYKKTSLYTKSESGWACQLGTTLDPRKSDLFAPHLLEKSPIIEGDLVKTSWGEDYYIVHQYDRIPNLLPIIERKYGD